jgi:hypothetical protein
MGADMFAKDQFLSLNNSCWLVAEWCSRFKDTSKLSDAEIYDSWGGFDFDENVVKLANEHIPLEFDEIFCKILKEVKINEESRREYWGYARDFLQYAAENNASITGSY